MFEQPKQGKDGRYYTRAAEPKFVQVNKVQLLSAFADGDAVTLELDDTASIMAVDNMVVSAAKENSELWFGKKVSDKTLEAGYTGSVSNGTMIVDKATLKGACVVRAFNSDRTNLDVNELPEGAVCDAVLEFAGVNFFKKNYSAVWKIVQIKLRPVPKSKRQKYTDECMFENDESEPEPESENESDDGF